MEERAAVVLDLGSHTLRLGQAGDDQPSHVGRNIVGKNQGLIGLD